MKWALTGLVIGLLIGSPSAACAVWFRSASVEWQTNVCDVVAIADVVNTSEREFAKEMELAKAAARSEPPREHWRRSQMVACRITKALKGHLSGPAAFRQDYYQGQNNAPIDDRPLRPGDTILIFAVEKPAPRREKVAFWVNLTKPDIVKAQHAAYNNDCKWLADGDSILKSVETRIDLERKTGKTRRRGLIVWFTAGPPEDLYRDFVRTADPDYKATLIKQLHDTRWPDGQQTAIYNLISYPGQDTIKLVRPFLKNASTTEVGFSGATVKVFYLRQAAYAALQLLAQTRQSRKALNPAGLSGSCGAPVRGSSLFSLRRLAAA